MSLTFSQKMKVIPQRSRRSLRTNIQTNIRQMGYQYYNIDGCRPTYLLVTLLVLWVVPPLLPQRRGRRLAPPA